jgi:hypothetical protein
MDNKANIKTFELLKESFKLAKLRSNLIDYTGLIDHISISEFKKLFSKKPESISVNWRGNKNQLTYFIKLLIDRKVINRYGAWAATSKYFTVNGAPILNKNIRKVEPIEFLARKRVENALLLVY